ncbi:histone-lysine N-methyltransferase, H3 lysine-9 specific SUVH4 isoform X1 [Lycium barbarum]|uniref:histone-lysine N-methyltransferase, H3 lysine-9 specific SUVH4 isoform X1 n=1 Tax=Lycium barbarum TaxID=112863 RepID=UPI00293EFA45|nr:histone-lysine N-methyltransferase, H3 lysine-9 specific SUVH4 isoform X1 [Lycium barbarum]
MVVACLAEPNEEAVVPVRRCSSRIKVLKSEEEARRARAGCPSTPPPPDKKPKKRKVDTAVDNVEVTVTDNDCTDHPASQSLNGNGNEKSAHVRVTETIRRFNQHYLHFVQEEEKRCETAKADLKAKKNSKSEVGNTYVQGAEDDGKRSSKRPDLKAVSKMKSAKEVLNSERIGHIPGIDVGHQFFSRAEMVVVGFHIHWLNGIDCVAQTAGRKAEYKGYKLPLAVSIVVSGQYEDDQDNYEEVVYTGQGGNDLLGNKRQIKDQIMERGNLGLKNCMEHSVPVRVTRGHKCVNSYVGKVYTYDGLYEVVNYWAEKGISGFTVYKFRLKRMGGQPVLTTNQVHFTRGCIPNSISEIRGLVCEDISGGLENIPIPATNLVDDPPVAPTGFTYSREIIYAKGIKLPSAPTGCNCRGSCLDPRECSCAKLNGSDFPYVHKDGGRLIEPKAVVFECGPNCGCGPACVNRTSQKGLRYRLEVFRTPNKGWGVRSWDYIPSGATICEYIGFLKKTDQIDPAADNNYVFDIDCLQTMKGLDGRERRLGEVSLPGNWQKDVEKTSDGGPEYCIDAVSVGNVARFINHSCQPNLFVQCVLSTHLDIGLARVVLMAADNIPPLQELTYDYGYILDSVMDRDGKVKQMACYCGAADCRKRLF